MLQPGDSGSTVVDARNGNTLGHIVLGSPKTGTAYIVPMYQIMDNIAKRSDISLGVSTRTTPPQPIQTICNVRSILVSRGIQTMESSDLQQCVAESDRRRCLEPC